MSADTESPAIRADTVRSLITCYARCLDELRITDWPAYFADEAHYEVNSRENVERGLELALVYDHTRARIHDRVTYIVDVWEGHYNPYWPRHIIGESVETERQDGVIEAQTPFALYITETGSIGSRLLVVGQYEDEIVPTPDGLRFRRRRVLLDTTVLPRYFVYPI